MFHHIFRSFILDICLYSVFVLSLRPEINNNQKMNKIKTTKLLAIGIIGEYLGRIFNETKRRPPYIADSLDGEPVDSQS